MLNTLAGSGVWLGCQPAALPPGAADREADHTDICQKRSVNGGATWSPLAVVARGGLLGSQVVHAATGRLILHYTRQLQPCAVAGTCVEVTQIHSDDHGATWSAPCGLCAGARVRAGSGEHGGEHGGDRARGGGVGLLPESVCRAKVAPGVGLALVEGQPTRGKDIRQCGLFALFC